MYRDIWGRPARAPLGWGPPPRVPVAPLRRGHAVSPLASEQAFARTAREEAAASYEAAREEAALEDAARAEAARERAARAETAREQPARAEVANSERVREDAARDARLTEASRARTELEAMKGRLARDAERAREASRTQLVAELLPVLDNLDRAISAGSSDPSLLAGVKLVRDQLEGVVAGMGLDRIVALGAPFDPAQHEAVAVVPVSDEASDGVVLDELSRGYRQGGRTLVPARVRVGKLAA